MGEPAKRGIGRWVILGCAGCGGLMLLGAAGCAGFLYYLHRQTDPIAAVGAAYLRNAAEVRAAFGEAVTARRTWTKSRVHLTNDGGTAYFTYELGGPRAEGRAEVWLSKARGTWTASGARVRPAKGGPDIPLGTLPPGRAFGED